MPFYFWVAPQKWVQTGLRLAQQFLGSWQTIRKIDTVLPNQFEQSAGNRIRQLFFAA